MKTLYKYISVAVTVTLLIFFSFGLAPKSSQKLPGENYTTLDRQPRIRPDYCDTVIPPNIAPLNFLVEEVGTSYYVKIYSKSAEPIEIFSRSPKIIIPLAQWRKLLDANRGQKLCFDVYAQAPDGKWLRFAAITNTIAEENIDPFLVYRKIHPAHNMWSRMGIYQRNLENFDEQTLMDNEHFKRGCLNCHSFCGNHPDKMFISIRSEEYGSSAILAEDGSVNKIGTKFGYTSWHPNGRLAAYSINFVGQFFHTARNEVRDVIDLDSALAYYNTDSKISKTFPDIAKKDELETYPAWSPDGRYLYFSRAPLVWGSSRKELPPNYDQVRYDLMRISYDAGKDRWGPVETVLSSKDTGLSILEPRISPDGRWLLCCMCDYGCFPVYQQSSDLYLIDLKAAEQTGRFDYQRLDINSDQSESWHGWSSNNRWFAFSSKKDYGKFTRIYISYIDDEGNVGKPIIVSQKDPAFYDSCLKTFSVPELITGPVRVSKEKIGSAIRGTRKIEVAMPITMATPKAGTPPGQIQAWQQRE
jgi:hypothetical protein